MANNYTNINLIGETKKKKRVKILGYEDSSRVDWLKASLHLEEKIN
jgi:hypothetical protein